MAASLHLRPTKLLFHQSRNLKTKQHKIKQKLLLTGQEVGAGIITNKAFSIGVVFTLITGGVERGGL